jgi:hypothetical protein
LGAPSSDICLYVFNGSHEDLLRLSAQMMGAKQPIALPEDALARLWGYAIRQGWEV